MGGASNKSTPYLRFAVISFIACAIAVAALSYLGSEAAADREREAAARAAATLVADPLRPFFDPVDKTVAVPDEVRAAVDPVVLTLLGGETGGLRVASQDGAVLYEAGTRFLAGPVSAANSGFTSTGGRSSDGESLFVTIAYGDGYIIEVAQNAGPIDRAAAGARGQFVAGALTLATVVWVIFQGAFVFVSRPLVREHLRLALATVVWVIFQGAFVFVSRPLVREHLRLAYLYATGEQLRSSMDVHDVLTQLARDATGLGGGQFGMIVLFDDATSEAVLRATFDARDGSAAQLQRPIDDWFVRRCIATNTTIVSTMNESMAHQHFGSDAPLQGEIPVLCAPMAIRDRVVGAIGVVQPTAGRGGFAPSDVEIIERLCAQAVTAVEQAQLLTKIRSDAKELEASYDSTLKALMAALDAKDESTEGHCERVAKLTVHLARHMGLPEAQLVHIERGAMLHDVGKIGVPDEVLKKPDSLTENEWTTMRKHPMLAGLMVSKVGFLEPAMPILLYHHERFDGGGYPFGLAGGNIPIEARIFTIVDAYDAMTQDRPYRDAMTHEQAMTEIYQHNGSQFDPNVVDAFADLMGKRPDLRGTLAHSRQSTLNETAHFEHDHEDAA